MAEATKALYIDMAYVTAELRQRKHEAFFEARHSGGFFDRVWAVHPLADRVDPSRARRIETIAFSDRQTVIEGSSEFYRLPTILRPLNFLLSQFKLLRKVIGIVSRERIPLVIATDPLYTGLFGLAVKKRCGIPLVVHAVANQDDLYATTGVVAYPKLFPSRALEKRIIQFVLKRCDLVTPGTETLSEYVIRNGAAPDRVAVFPVSRNMPAVHLVPPEERPDPAATFERWGIPANHGPFLISIARLEPVKLVDDAIRAMKVVIDKHPGAIGIIAGQGQLRGELEKLVDELGIRANIRFLGLVDHESLSIMIPHCITVSPLTGMAMFESAMGGSPIVAYEYDKLISTIVDHERSGFIVPLHDWQKMGEKLLAIVDDAELRNAMSRCIREIALNYTPERLFKHENEVYRQLLDSSDAHSGIR